MRGVRVRALSAAVVAVGVAALTGCGGTLSSGGTTGGAGTTGAAGRPGRGGAPGRGGTTGAAGTTGQGGTTGEGGTGGIGDPGPCPTTVSKGVPCTSSDPQFCSKTCGPEKVGTKAETCASGVYVEMSGCTFDPSRDYSCYKIPTAVNSTCPAEVPPQASAACEVPPCMLCNSLQGLAGGQYLDASGAAKVGYCVCQQPNAAGVRTWSCASDTAWPCPINSGC
jgi:hypothetical protein